MKKLVNARLMKVERMVITDEGVKYELYRSTVRSINVRFVAGSLEVDATIEIVQERRKEVESEL